MSASLEQHFLHRGHGAEFDMEVDWIIRHVPQHACCIVDIGCGNGALFGALGASRVIGVDFLPDGLALTRTRFPQTPLICADAARLPLPDAVADVVTCQHLIEHLPDPAAACREWNRILRPGGIALVLTPNAWFSDLSVFDDESHQRLFTAPELRGLMGASGLESMETCTLGLPWFREHRRIPGGWRLRRCVTRHAERLAAAPPLRWRGQTLCCAARRTNP